MQLSSSCEVNSSLVCVEIRRVMWKFKVYYRVHSKPVLVHIITQTKTVHRILTYYFGVHFYVTLIM